MSKERFSSQVLYTLAAQALGLIVNLGNAMVVARILGPEGKGWLELALLLPVGLALLFGCGVPIANVRYLGTQQATLSQLSQASVGLSLLLTAAGGVLVLLAAIVGAGGTLFGGLSLALLGLAMLGFPAALLQSYLVGILHGQERIKLVNRLQLGQSSLLCALNLILVWALDLSVTGAVVAWVLTLTAFLSLTLWILHKSGASLRPRLDRDLLRGLLGFGLKNHVASALQFLNYRLDVFLVQAYLGPAAVGLYGVGVRLGELLWQLPGALGFVLLPRAAQAKGRAASRRLAWRAAWLGVAVSLVGALALGVGGRWLIELLFSKRFSAAYPALVALLPGIVCFSAWKVLCNYIAGEGYPQTNAWISGAGLVVTVALDLLWIPPHGIVGAAWATSASYALMTLLTVVAFLRLPPIPPEDEDSPEQPETPATEAA
jgi:O-antigen/teichoic acid export membrane protein